MQSLKGGEPMDNIERMPSYRRMMADMEGADHARDLEIERVYQDTLDEHMSGLSETSYLMEVIENDTGKGGLWHQLMDALVQSLTDQAECGRQIREIYEKAAEKHAELKTEDI